MQNITLDDEANLHSRSAISPVGVYNLRVADRISRDIFFVACCRSLGIPARINPVTHMTEYWLQGKWNVASLDNSSENQPVIGFLQLTESGESLLLRNIIFILPWQSSGMGIL